METVRVQYLLLGLKGGEYVTEIQIAAEVLRQNGFDMEQTVQPVDAATALRLIASTEFQLPEMPDEWYLERQPLYLRRK